MTAKRLRKFSAAVLCALICIAASLLSVGAAQRYIINEIDDMIIYLPDNMTAVTRSSVETDKYFSVFGLDYNTEKKNFENGDIYLQGMDSASALTVTVTMTKTSDSQSIGNYNLLKSDELSNVTSNFLSQSEYISCTPDTSEKIVWLIFNTNVISGGVPIKAYQANTVYDGMSVSVTLQRNGGSVTAQDYAVFSEVVSSADFMKKSSVGNNAPYIIIGAAVLFIAAAILLAIFVKRAKKFRKKNKNDKIIEELSGKYASKRARHSSKDYSDGEAVSKETAPEETERKAEPFDKTRTFMPLDSGNSAEQDGEDLKIYSPAKKIYGEKEIEEILESKRIENLKTEAESENTAEVVYSNSEYGSDEYNDSIQTKSDIGSQFEDRLFGGDYDEFDNDEELARQEAKRVKFDDSDDFFEEAPKKVMGVISSKEIRDAEDFDVINEVEKRVSEVENPAPNAGESFVKVMMKVGGGLKYFGVHCGYFCTNVYRMIKRRRAAQKRRRAEEERRERARQRAQRQNAQRREAGDGLVRVHSRSDRRPAQNGRRGSQQRRPSGSQGRGNRR